MMKKLKLKFCNFWSSFDERNNLFYNLLKRHFDIDISENPDFVFCSNRGKLFEYMKYDCPRIMFMGESLSPDWSCIDYCLGFDYMDFGDRFFRLTYGLYFDDAKPFLPEILSREQAENILKGKQYFCNFIYRTSSPNGIRDEMFNALNSYKHVVSPGLYMNNVENTTSVKGITYPELNEYISQSKFTIAGESFSFPGIVTEKIVRPFMRHSIPIYYGNPRIAEDFNPKAFVECRSLDDIPNMLEQVRYLDTHDGAYLEMLMQSPFHDNSWCVKHYEALEKWLVDIVSQSREHAYRRAQDGMVLLHQEALRKMALRTKSSFMERCIDKLYSWKKELRKKLVGQKVR